MKHFHNVSEEDSQFEKKNVKKIFIDPLEFFSKNGKYSIPKREKKRFRQINVVSRGQDISNEQFEMNQKIFKPFHITEAKAVTTKSPPPIVRNSQSKIFTIIDDDDDDINNIITNDNPTHQPPTKIQSPLPNKQPISIIVSEIFMKFPNSIKNKKPQQSTNEKHQSISYVNSRINTPRAKHKHGKKHKSQSNYQLYSGGSINRTIDQSKQQLGKQQQQLCQKHALPNINRQNINRQGEQQIRKKKQMKLSGVSVMPSLKVSPHNDKSTHSKTTTTHKRQISLMPSQLIHNNPISSVKKSVYQLLVKKNHSYF